MTAHLTPPCQALEMQRVGLAEQPPPNPLQSNAPISCSKYRAVRERYGSFFKHGSCSVFRGYGQSCSRNFRLSSTKKKKKKNKKIKKKKKKKKKKIPQTPIQGLKTPHGFQSSQSARRRFPPWPGHGGVSYFLRRSQQNAKRLQGLTRVRHC